MDPEGGGYTLVEGYLVDLEGLAGIAHRCEPALCRASGSCCAAHEVWLGEEERRRILKVMPIAARWLADGEAPAGAVQQWGPDAYALARNEAGLCAFAYRGGDGRILCSLHSAAPELGLSPEEAKPDSCVLWPLSLASSRPPVLSVQEGALRYPCNRRRAAGGLDDGIARILRQVFGEELLAAVRRLAQAGGE